MDDDLLKRADRAIADSRRIKDDAKVHSMRARVMADASFVRAIANWKLARRYVRGERVALRKKRRSIFPLAQDMERRSLNSEECQSC
jgi:hypothetical protein